MRIRFIQKAPFHQIPFITENDRETNEYMLLNTGGCKRFLSKGTKKKIYMNFIPCDIQKETKKDKASVCLVERKS